jgi:hypothetical protein
MLDLNITEYWVKDIWEVFLWDLLKLLQKVLNTSRNRIEVKTKPGTGGSHL